MRVVVLLSGGMDSAVLAWQLRADGYEVSALSVLYGQRHSREVESARAVAAAGGFPHRVVDLEALRAVMGGSALTDSVPVPHGHYADESMRSTVVPNRNMVLLAVAGAMAASVGAEAVAYAAHAGDHAIYPDCRPEFVAAMARALALCHYGKIALLAPFAGMSKGDIARTGVALGVPFGLTWTCYEGGAVHCGRCGACTERREAFTGLDDPTEYA